MDSGILTSRPPALQGLRERSRGERPSTHGTLDERKVPKLPSSEAIANEDRSRSFA